MPKAVKEKVQASHADGFHFIASEAELNETVDRLKKADRIACDIEADSMYHYQEKVCLIQVAAGGEVFIIDPLPVRKTEIFRRLFSTPTPKKIFHGADYDIRSLYRDYSVEMAGLFDTQIAARFLGIQETGLESLLNRFFDLKLDKKFQKKDWSRRPLPEEMVAYAAEDVAHLLPLADLLEARLAALGRLSWVEEECEILNGVRPADENGAPLFLRFKGAGRLRPRELAVLEAILQYRKQVAKAKDRPFFKTFSNRSMLDLAKTRPRTLKNLKNSNTLSERQIQMYGTDLVEAFEEAMNIPEQDLPVYPRKKPPPMHPSVPKRVRALRIWRDRRAGQLDLDPSVLLTKSLMTAVAVLNPQDPEALEQIPEMRKWQREEFGSDIVSALKGGR